jgi:predicted enzyme related to lactoylglutathione lyase
MTALPVTQQITWVYTEDLESTARFYERTLGLATALDQGQCRVYRTSPTSYLGLCRVRPGRWVEPKGVVLTLLTPDVEAWHAHLVAAGADVQGPAEYHAAFRCTAFFVKDPNGYLIELQRFEDERWRE